MHQDSAELARLIGALAEGDQGALRVLYERTAPKLLGILLRILRDRAAAEDALQDVFVRVWQRAAGYDPSAGAPLAWLTAIARHRAIDAVRQERARRMTAQDEEDWLDRLDSAGIERPTSRAATPSRTACAPSTRRSGTASC